jgi:hypothetical protein
MSNFILGVLAGMIIQHNRKRALRLVRQVYSKIKEKFNK